MNIVAFPLAQLRKPQGIQGANHVDVRVDRRAIDLGQTSALSCIVPV